MAGSLHLYDKDATKAQSFLDEGFFFTRPMPPMPNADPMPAVVELLAFEEQSRRGTDPLAIDMPSDPYWADLARLLAIFELDHGGRKGEIASVARAMSTDVYNLHIDDRIDRA